MVWSTNPAIRNLLLQFEHHGCKAFVEQPVTVNEPNDSRLVTLKQGGVLAAVVILTDTKVMGYRLFREIDTFTVIEDAELILAAEPGGRPKAST